MEIVLIVGIIVVVLFAAGILIYNGLVQKRLRIDEAYAQIEVQLKRRWDLIPNLVKAVQGYMGFEQQVLTDVTEARANAVAAGSKGPHEQAVAENALTSTLRSLFAVVENYPDLKANTNVLELQEQLTTTENQISFARQHYNATVLDYNTSIQQVPAVLIAGPLGFSRRDFFDAEPEAEQVPEVDLGFGREEAQSADSAPGQSSPPYQAPPPRPQQPGPPPYQGPPQPPPYQGSPPQGPYQGPPGQQPPPPPGYRPPPPPR